MKIANAENLRHWLGDLTGEDMRVFAEDENGGFFEVDTVREERGYVVLRLGDYHVREERGYVVLRLGDYHHSLPCTGEREVAGR